MADSPDFTKKILVDVQLKSEQIKNDQAGKQYQREQHNRAVAEAKGNQ